MEPTLCVRPGSELPEPRHRGAERDRVPAGGPSLQTWPRAGTTLLHPRVGEVAAEDRGRSEAVEDTPEMAAGLESRPPNHEDSCGHEALTATQMHSRLGAQRPAPGPRRVEGHSLLMSIGGTSLFSVTW